MLHRFGFWIVLSIIPAFGGMAPSPAKAGNIFEDAYNVVTDPVGLRRSSATLSDSVERTLIQLKALEGVANSHVEQRLEQMRSILRDAIGGANEVIAAATDRMLSLEAQVNTDAINLIYTAKCAVDITLKTTAEQALAALLNDLSKAKPSIRFLGVTFIDLRTKRLTIDNPNQAYVSAKKEAMDALDKEVTDSSPAKDIMFTYSNLQAAARYALCYYTLNGGGAGRAVWLTEANEMERLLLPWTMAVRPDINYVKN